MREENKRKRREWGNGGGGGEKDRDKVKGWSFQGQLESSNRWILKNAFEIRNSWQSIGNLVGTETMS